MRDREVGYGSVSAERSVSWSAAPWAQGETHEGLRSAGRRAAVTAPSLADRHFADDLSALLDEIGRIGAGAWRGQRRAGLSDAERTAMDVIAARMAAIGCEVETDAVGNLLATWTPPGADGPPVVTGSHLDAVPGGGRIDGVAGVAAAVLALEYLVDVRAPLRRPARLVVFTSAVAGRFGHARLGSLAAASGLTRSQLACRDADGVSFAEALTAAGGDPRAAELPWVRPGSVAAFLEVHAELGPHLDAEHVPVGIATSSAAAVALEVVIDGVAAHAGATPMHARVDALAAAAEAVLLTGTIAAAHEDTVGSVTNLVVIPGAPGVLPEQVRLTLDLRSATQACCDEAEQAVRAGLADLAVHRGVVLDVTARQRSRAAVFDATLGGLLEDAAAAESIPVVTCCDYVLPDAVSFAGVVPTGLILVRSDAGAGCSPEEYSRPEDLAAATRLLVRALASLAGAPLP